MISGPPGWPGLNGLGAGIVGFIGARATGVAGAGLTGYSVEIAGTSGGLE